MAVDGNTDTTDSELCAVFDDGCNATLQCMNGTGFPKDADEREDTSELIKAASDGEHCI